MTILPTVEIRCETGALKFGRDWPGVFIRGDEAGSIADRLRSDEWRDATVKQLIDLLQSCQVK